jgi:DNA-binding PadR family transcriptional regulator
MARGVDDGLPVALWLVLLVILKDSDKPLTGSSLARRVAQVTGNRTGAHVSHVTHTLRTLQARGFVFARALPDDARGATLYHATSKGRERAAKETMWVRSVLRKKGAACL